MKAPRGRRAASLIAIICAIAVIASVAAAPASAHEFWLEPSSYQPKVGEKTAIRIRNGMNFKGNNLPFITAWTRQFQLTDKTGTRSLSGLDGDDPAAEVTFKSPGLAIATFYGTPDLLEFKTWEKFTSYLKDEGLERLVKQHRARGLPESDIKESYSRCAKALISVGDGKGEDRAIGMPLEIIAERNPFQLAKGAPLPVKVLYQGKPIAGILIKIFNKSDPGQPRRVITGSDGRAMIKLPIKGEYLLNAVHMFEPPKDSKMQWHSLWASLTFSLR